MTTQLCLNSALILSSVLIMTPLQAQSLNWANLEGGNPTGTFISLPGLSTSGSTLDGTRYLQFVELGADNQFTVGDRFFAAAIAPPPAFQQNGFAWPGTTSGLLAGDYRFESTFEGSISSIGPPGTTPFSIDVSNQVIATFGPSFDATINSGQMKLFNSATNELIANLTVQNGLASGLSWNQGNAGVPGNITLSALLGPGCVNCDPYIRMPDGSSISDRSIITTFTGQAPIFSNGYQAGPEGPEGVQSVIQQLRERGFDIGYQTTLSQLSLFIQNNGTSSTFDVQPLPPVQPPPFSMLGIINADNILEGSNGSPMRTLVARGQSSIGATGSVGRNDHQGFNGNLGNGQLRFSHNFGFAQLNLSSGGLLNPNNDTFKGDATLHGAYVIPEIIAKIPQTPVHATLTGLYSAGEVNPNVTTAGGRLRFDWLDALKIGKTAFTPYTSYTFIYTGVASYLQNAGVPILWDNHSDHVDTARYGLDAVYGLTTRINLLARVEGSHRFEDRTSNVTGQRAGINLDLPGQTYKTDWMRGAVGVEGKVGKHFVGVLLNATSQGPVTSYWLTANYRAAF